jgi:hypothetical protein
MIDASKLPRVPNEVLQKQEQQPVEYVRAPVATGTPVIPGRPPATQETTR